MRFYLASLFTWLLTISPGLPLEQNLTLQDKEQVSLSKLKWQFYWQKLLKPNEFKDEKPDLVITELKSWHRLNLNGAKLPSFGYATYRTKFKLISKHRELGLSLPSPLSSHILYVNGRQLANAGKPGKTKEETLSRRRASVVYFSIEKPEIEIIVQTANFVHHKAGVRGNIKLASAANLQTSERRTNALDLFVIGIIFSIMLYHFVLFSLRRKEKANLVFALLALVSFLLAFNFGRQSIALFLPELPFSIQLHFGAFSIYIIPGLLITFIHKLYTGLVPKWLYWGIWAAVLIFLIFLFFPTQVFTRMHPYFFLWVAIPSVVLSLFLSAKGILEKRPGATLMFSGILLFLILVSTAIFLALKDHVSGLFVSIGFAIFSLFQAAALAREHSQLEKQNTTMQVRLKQGREALEKQRSEIEANLHDNIGGSLTDLKLATDNLVRTDLPPAAVERLTKMSKKINSTIGSLRTQLLFLEDIEMVMQDFFSGIQLILLRRYTSASREFEFYVDDSAFDLLENPKTYFSEAAKLDFILMLQEICTNSLKYGGKLSIWSFKGVKGILEVELKSDSLPNPSKNTDDTSGLGSKTLQDRSSRLKAVIRETEIENFHQIQLSLPLIAQSN